MGLTRSKASSSCRASCDTLGNKLSKDLPDERQRDVRKLELVSFTGNPSSFGSFSPKTENICCTWSM